MESMVFGGVVMVGLPWRRGNINLFGPTWERDPGSSSVSEMRIFEKEMILGVRLRFC